MPPAEITDSGGYVLVYAPEHPKAWHNRIRKHVLVMESMIGRRLLPGENVHHRNGVRDDNRPENLELWAKAQPTGARVCDQLAWARQIIARYDGLHLECDGHDHHDSPED